MLFSVKFSLRAFRLLLNIYKYSKCPKFYHLSKDSRLHSFLLSLLFVVRASLAPNDSLALRGDALYKERNVQELWFEKFTRPDRISLSSKMPDIYATGKV